MGAFPSVASIETLPTSGVPRVWSTLRIEAATAAAEEPILASLLNATILNHASFADALSYHLAQKLGGADMNALQIRDVCAGAFAADPAIVARAEADVRAVRMRDPACLSYLQPFLYYKGFSALQAHRVAHHLWHNGRETLAFHLQSRVSELLQVDIHPAATLGQAIFMDHATGIVIGETAVVGDNVSMLHNVTLGGTGKEGGDRHPKIAAGVLIGAGAKVLGNIRVGEGARIASGSVVLHDVPAGCTVAGIPAKAVGGPCCENPADSMDQVFDVATFDPGL
jgi:serine O-acetyltransferase